jgi:hypothetical protein
VNPKQFFPRTGEWKCLWKSLSPLLNFWDFLKTHGCMMDFQQASRGSECRQGKGFGAGQCACDCCPCVQASGRKMRKNQECFLRLGISLLGALVRKRRADPAGRAAAGCEFWREIRNQSRLVAGLGHCRDCGRHEFSGQVFVSRDQRYLRGRANPARFRGLPHRPSGLSYASQHCGLHKSLLRL